jgi:hypothetical protein
MEYVENRYFSSVLKNRVYNYITSNFDILDLWRLWKSSVVVRMECDIFWVYKVKFLSPI